MLGCPRPPLFIPPSPPPCIRAGQCRAGQDRVSVAVVPIWLFSFKARHLPSIEFSFPESEDSDYCAPGAVQLHVAGYSGLTIN